MATFPIKRTLSHAILMGLPRLEEEGYCVSSRKSKTYNCITFAVRDEHRIRLEPSGESGDEWPLPLSGDPDVDYAFENFVKVFQMQEYELCVTSSFEVGFEKVALFKDAEGEFSHVCKQMRNGKWHSKLGDDEDIKHASLVGLVSDGYGLPEVFMKRKIKP